MTNHQRIGAISNAHVGREFELLASAYFHQHEGLDLSRDFAVPLGHGDRTKLHRFDLGSEDPAVLVECKSHNWTATGNMPSAKMTVWNEAMYYFHLAPNRYRKVLFVLDARHSRRGISLAEFYFKTSAHLIPPNVTLAEYNMETGLVQHITIDCK